ncbi:lipocalin-like domain-containing protein [Pseudonocardiaceae bacterium YIM PH 21723]|nr:lipocalin-like domain-containing protein [Pseudonocardiaceae bacterium YIM PH 21723]
MSLDIHGRWELVSWTATLPDGTEVHPFGEGGGGSLVYTPGGFMTGQLWAAERPPVSGDNPLGGTEAERAAAYSTFVSYSGGFEVRGDHIAHKVTASLFPNWVGEEQIRFHELDGDRLVLRTPPVDLGQQVGNTLSWVRVERW